MIRNIFKEKKEIKEQASKLKAEMLSQSDKFLQMLTMISMDAREYDKTYVIYSSEFSHISITSIESCIERMCNTYWFSYDKRFYPDGVIFYINVKKRKEPKYNVGDIVHLDSLTYSRASDVMVLGRAYDGKGRYKYLVPSQCKVTDSTASFLWRYL